MKKLLLFLFLFLFLYNFYRIYEYRKKPSRSYFISQFGKKSSFLNYANRYLILYEGQKLYRQEIKFFLENIDLHDDSYNRFILKQIASKRGDYDFFKNLFSYPFKKDISQETATRLSSQKSCFLLDEHYSSINHKYLFEEEIKKKDTIEDMPDYYSLYTNDRFSGWSSNELQEKLSECAYEVYRNLKKINKILIAKEKEIFPKMSTLDINSINHYIFLHLQTNTQMSQNFLEKDLMAKKKIPLTLIIKYLDSKSIKEVRLIKQYLIDNIKVYSGEQVGIICSSVKDKIKINELLGLLAKVSERKAAHAFHALIIRDLVFAEEVSKKYIKEKDTILKKAVIGLLVKHNSHIGNKYIEELFKGKAQRIIGLPFHYYQDTNAVKEYCNIARHDYLEVGKAFPPIYCKDPLVDEVMQWEEFIKKYPLFPGVDDAYYHLIFRLVKDGRIGEANNFIAQYEKLDFPDTDATDLILKISKLILAKKIDEDFFYFNIKHCEERGTFE